MTTSAPEWFGSAARNASYPPIMMVFFMLVYLLWWPFVDPVWGSIIIGAGAVYAAIITLCAVRNIRHAAQFPNVSTPEGALIGKRMGILSGVTYGTLWAVVIALAVFGHWRWILPSVALIIGLHFFPLALIFQRRIDYLLGPIAVGFAGVGFVLAAQSGAPWSVVYAVSGIGGAIATAVYSTYLLFTYRHLCGRAGLAGTRGAIPGPSRQQEIARSDGHPG